jgi:hypothetical protein
MSSQSLNVARPILKSRLNSIKSPRPTGKQVSLKVPSSPRAPSSKVHFPPTPTISIIFETHANEVYDRTSIVVSPSSTAIPWSKKNRLNISGRATVADIFCTPVSEVGSKVESLVKGSASDYSDSEESDAVPELDNTTANARTVRFAASPLRSPIPGRRSQFDLDKALSFLPHAPASPYPTAYPVSPYPRSPSFDPRSPSSDKGNKKGFGVTREARVHLPTLKRETTTASDNKPKAAAPAASKKGSFTPRRRPAQLNLDTLTVPTTAIKSPPMRFAPPGLPVSPMPARSINAVLDESDSGSDSDSDSEGRSLRAAFWRSVTLEKRSSLTTTTPPNGGADGAAATLLPESLVSPALASPFPVFLYKNLRSPALPRKSRASAGDFMGNAAFSLMSPNTLGKNLEALTSPAPKDPAAAFTSFASAFATLA